MVIALEFLIQYANSVPQLAILYIIKRVECSLVGLETVLQIIDKKVAVAESRPSWPVDRVNAGDLHEVLDGLHVVTVGSTSLRHAVYRLYLHLTFAVQMTIVRIGRGDLLLLLELSHRLRTILHLVLLAVISVHQVVEGVLLCLYFALLLLFLVV